MNTLAHQLTDYIQAAFAGLWVQTHEPDEAQREIARLCDAQQWQLDAWDCAAGLHSNGQGVSDPLTPLKALRGVPSAKDKPRLLCLHHFHRFLTNPLVVQELVNAVIWGKGEHAYVVVLSPLVQIPLELEKLFVVVDHPLPTRDQLAAIARELDGVHDIPEDSTPISAAAGLTRYEAEGAFALSLARHGGVVANVIWELKAQLLKKTGLLELHQGNERFADLGGLAALKSFCLKALAPRSAATPVVVSPRGLLLLGVPGTGKSAFVKALGNEIQRPTLTLDIGSLYGSLVGETESKIRQALKTADAMAPCVLFIDEIEKALSGVGGNGDSGVSTRLFGTILTWLNDHASDVFVIATCNDVAKLPPEFSRAERWDGIFFIDLPGDAERKAIWSLYLRQYGHTDTGIKVTGNAIPDDGQWTGAEIKACCRLAALLDCPLLDAARNVVPVALTASEKIAALREWASGRCLSAALAGVYQSRPETANHAPRRRVLNGK